MIPLPDAQARVMSTITTLGETDVELSTATGLVLARAVDCNENIPPFSNTAMDGFAVRAADTAGASVETPGTLKLVGTIAAGAVAERPLEAGEAMRIMTGAPMPDGADAVIMVELTESAEEIVTVLGRGARRQPHPSPRRRSPSRYPGVRTGHRHQSGPYRDAGHIGAGDDQSVQAAPGWGVLHRR